MRYGFRAQSGAWIVLWRARGGLRRDAEIKLQQAHVSSDLDFAPVFDFLPPCHTYECPCPWEWILRTKCLHGGTFFSPLVKGQASFLSSLIREVGIVSHPEGVELAVLFLAFPDERLLIALAQHADFSN